MNRYINLKVSFSKLPTRHSVPASWLKGRIIYCDNKNG